MLNEGQRLAYYTYADFFLMRQRGQNMAPCRLYIEGGAGTGKSHVARAIIALVACPSLVARGGREKLLTCAFQGRQAAALGSTTVHSIANIPDERFNKVTSRLSVHKKAFWNHITILIIEEISMVSVKMLAALHVAAVTALGTDTELLFGGLDVIALGDFSQLEAVASNGLSSGFTTKVGAAILATASTAAFGGQHLFLSMTAWVMLTRCKLVSEPLRSIVERLREGKCTEAD